MAREFSRTRRVGEQIRRDLAELIRSEIRDSRMAMVSITGVNVTRDFAHAKVYVTVLGDSVDRDQVVATLNHASGMLRRELGRRMHIRSVPRIEFKYDDIVEQGARLSSLIADAVASDRAKHVQSGSDGDDT